MSIERIECFKYNGRIFESEEKAIDYAESLVDAALKAPLIAKGFTANEAFKVALVILENRQALLRLLDY